MDEKLQGTQDAAQAQAPAQPAGEPRQTDIPELRDNVGKAIIKVVGVGGGGCNAVKRMYRNRIPEVEYVVVNTDKQALDVADVPISLRIGDNTARGLGVGGDPARGRACMEEDVERMRRKLQGADMVFVAAGMGGGTGTGGAPIAAKVSREVGALTIGVVTKPFGFEGSKRMDQALRGIDELARNVDTLIVIPNDRLIELNEDRKLNMTEAFELADDVLNQGVQSIAELILVTGEINLDFADVRAIMDKAGPAWMAIGRGSGENRAAKAARAALESPLLEVDIQGARGVIYNVTGGSDMTLDEVTEAAEVISSMVHTDANVIFGTVTDDLLKDEVKLTIIATGFEANYGETRGGEYVIPTADEIMDEKTLEEMNLPPFLRNHPSVRQEYKKRVRDAQQTVQPAQQQAASEE